jgi:hypothetical protein
MSFRIDHHTDALRQFYALPHGVFQRVRAELQGLAERAALPPDAPGAVGPSPDAEAFFGRTEVEGFEVHYAVDRRRRVLQVVRITRHKAGEGA